MDGIWHYAHSSVSENGTDVDDVIQRLRAVVADRRDRGQYPPGLEEDLDAHFQRIIVSRTHVPRLALLRRKIEAARRASRFSPDRIPTSSRLPGGRMLHQSLTRVFLRQAVGILAQVQDFADRALEALDAAAAMAERPDNHQHDDLIEVLDAHSELLADRGVGDPTTRDVPDLGDDIGRRLERLEAAQTARRWRPWFGRSRFEAAFDHGERLRVEQAAAQAMQGCSPVLDLAQDNAIAVLAGTGSDSLGGAVLVQAEEVMTAQQVVDLIGLAFDRLRAGGRLVISYGLPDADDASAGVGKRPTFNPTLGPSLPANYVAFVCREAGFGAVDIDEWSSSGYLIAATR